MPAPSLMDSCLKACIKNVRSLTDIGSLEYSQVRPILQRIDSPDQLHQIELRCPHIQGDDAELWQAFIARDIPNWASKNYIPKNPLKWYEVYVKYKKEQRKEIERDEAILRETMMGLQKHRQTHVSKVVDMKTLPKLPRDPRMLANNGGVPLGKKVFRKEAPSTLNFTAGSKTKLTDGKSVLTRARREAKEISQMSKLARPTHKLALGQVSRAPAGIVEGYRIAGQPAVKILSSKGLMRRKPSVGTVHTGPVKPSLEDREARLRALTMGSKRDSSGAVKATIVGSSDEDDYEEEEVEDLFDDVPKPRPTPRPSQPSQSGNRPFSNNPAPSNTSRSRPSHSSPPSRPARPSDVISSLISKPNRRPSEYDDREELEHKPRPADTSPPPKSTIPQPRTASPRPMVMKKKGEVDVFNRKPKRPRNN